MVSLGPLCSGSLGCIKGNISREVRLLLCNKRGWESMELPGKREADKETRSLAWKGWGMKLPWSGLRGELAACTVVLWGRGPTRTLCVRWRKQL